MCDDDDRSRARLIRRFWNIDASDVLDEDHEQRLSHSIRIRLKLRLNLGNERRTDGGGETGLDNPKSTPAPIWKTKSRTKIKDVSKSFPYFLWKSRSNSSANILYAVQNSIFLLVYCGCCLNDSTAVVNLGGDQACNKLFTSDAYFSRAEFKLRGRINLIQME